MFMSFIDIFPVLGEFLYFSSLSVKRNFFLYNLIPNIEKLWELGTI